MILTTIDKYGLLELKSASIRKFLEDNKGKRVKIEVIKPNRSLSQNSFYWAYLAIIERETGNLADDLHNYFRRKLLPPKFIQVMGEEIKIPASTTELNKTDFGIYMDKIASLSGVPVPDPRLLANFTTNYN